MTFAASVLVGSESDYYARDFNLEFDGVRENIGYRAAMELIPEVIVRAVRQPASGQTEYELVPEDNSANFSSENQRELKR